MKHRVQLYLKCPEVEADIRHWVAPYGLRNILRKPEVSRDQHENALKHKSKQEDD